MHTQSCSLTRYKCTVRVCPSHIPGCDHPSPPQRQLLSPVSGISFQNYSVYMHKIYSYVPFHGDSTFKHLVTLAFFTVQCRRQTFRSRVNRTAVFTAAYCLPSFLQLDRCRKAFRCLYSFCFYKIVFLLAHILHHLLPR